MLFRELGTEGPRVSVLGLGAWPLAGGMGRVDERTAIATIHEAIDQGINLIDTVEAYLSSEEIIGKALRGRYRDRCLIASKASNDFSHEGITRALEKILKALRTEVIDLYQIHRWDPRYPVGESMETMARLKEQGKIRYVGVSNYATTQMRQAMETGPIQSNQLRYSLFDRQIEGEELQFRRRNGVGVLVHSPLAKGLLTGKYAPGHRFPPGDERARFARFQGAAFEKFLGLAAELGVIAAGKGVSLVQLALAWVMRTPAVTSVLVGVKSTDQLRDCLPAAGLKWREEELSRIDRIIELAPPTDSFSPLTAEAFE